MKKWRTVTIAAILGAMIILVSSNRFGWEPSNLFQRPNPGIWAQESPFFHRFALQEPDNSLLAVFSILATIYLAGVLAIYAFPARIRRMENSLKAGGRNLIKITLLGLLFTVVIFAIGLSSSVTMTTFPLAIFLGSILFIGAFLGIVSLAYTLGHYLILQAGWERLSPLLTYLLGLLLLAALANVPYLGIPARLIIVMIGIGLTTSTRFGSGKPWNLSALYEE